MNLNRVFSILVATPLIFISAAQAKERRPLKDVAEKAIELRIKKFDPDAIREAGFRNRTDLESDLQSIASKEAPSEEEVNKRTEGAPELRKDIRSRLARKYKRSSQAARQALARMGNESFLNEFIAGLTGSEAAKKFECIHALGYIRNRKAVPHLAELLDDSRGSNPKAYPIEIGSYAGAAENALSAILPDVAAEIENQHKQTGKSSNLLWKSWWGKNKNAFAKEPPPKPKK